ncbi:glycosyltransferase family 2 protein [Pedobacter yonginense]|uniref:glycosyltransferase family 2 protein n=1 Tax=Pedobacter yonginense TaxID=651869 RepID=UPI001403AF45|nr:glycosyltransferase family 2 protein [Pedobacter yonginense]
MNRIAICIPAYNAALYLGRLLKSVEAQEIPFDEVLVYNDASTDETAAIALKFNATVINGERNLGCSAGKNVLLNKTSCNYVHFHDADDELLPNFTHLAHQWIDNGNCPDVVLFDFEWRDQERKQLLSKSDFNDAALREDPIRYTILNQINPFCGLYKVDRLREIGGYDVDAKILYNEDVAFHCKLAIAGLTFAAEKEISIINWRMNNSMSASNQLKCAQAHYEVMKINADKLGNTYTKEIAYKLWANANALASFSDWDTAKKSIKLATKLNGKFPPEQESRLFKLLAKIDPYFGLYLREQFIRFFKPDLRKKHR